MKRLLAALLCLWCSCTLCKAFVVVSELTSEMRSFELFMHDYKESNGIFPESWDELESVSEHLDWSREPYKLRQRIAFVREEVIWENRLRGGRILAITRDAFRPETFRRSRWSGRIESDLLEPSYTVFVDRGGTIYFNQVPADIVAGIFKTAGAKLPEPSGLGPYPHEIRARRKQIQELAFYAICIAVISVGIIRIILRRRNGKAKEA